jgi:hypothetical protein
MKRVKQDLLLVVVMTLLLLPFAISISDAQQDERQITISREGIFTSDAQQAVAVIREGVFIIDAQEVLSVTADGINTEAREGSCVCIPPNRCCCGPINEPCHWCPGSGPCIAAAGE